MSETKTPPYEVNESGVLLPERFHSLPGIERDPLDGNGRGGGGDGMEARIARLESDMAHVLRETTTLATEMKDVRERLARVEVKIDHLPTKEYFNRALLGSLAIIAALIAFADRIQGFVGGQ